VDSGPAGQETELMKRNESLCLPLVRGQVGGSGYFCSDVFDWVDS
jgi:hypothetical protein